MPITSGEMLASLPADVLASFAEIPSDLPAIASEPESPQDDASYLAALENLDLGEPARAESSLVPEPGDEVAPAATAPDAAAAPPEDLPEGVTKFTDNKGRKKYSLEEPRYKTIYGNHKFVQAAQLMIGEPLNAAALEVRHRAFMAQDRLFANLTSGDPKLQTSVIDFMLKEMNEAREAGETSVDPSIPFADAVYDKLQVSSPDGFAELRYRAARDFIGEMFAEAARDGDKDLFAASQQYARRLAGIKDRPAGITDEQYLDYVRKATEAAGLPFHTADDMGELARPEDPAIRLARENEELRRALNGQTSVSRAEELKNWTAGHIKQVDSAVESEAIMPELAAVDEAWKKFPDDYEKNVLAPLKMAVREAIQNDRALNERINDLNKRIPRASSAQARNEFGEQIKNLIVDRARLAAGESIGPILKTAAELLAFRSQQNNGRREAGQQRTAPKGVTTPVTRSLTGGMPQFKDNKFDQATALAQAAKLFAALDR